MTITERARDAGIPETTARGAAKRAGVTGGREISDNEWTLVLAEIHAGPGRLPRAVNQKHPTGETLARFDSLIAAERATGISYRSILAVCRGRAAQAGGFLWEYTA